MSKQIKGVLGTKLGMTQVFDDDGGMVPVTVVEGGPCVVTAVRTPGSIGGCATPGRVFKGVRMAGRMGGVRTTAPNLTLHRVDPDRGLLLIKGAVPGPSGGLVLVRSAVKTPASAGRSDR